MQKFGLVESQRPEIRKICYKPIVSERYNAELDQYQVDVASEIVYIYSIDS